MINGVCMFCFTTRTLRWLDRKHFIRSEVRVTTEFRFRSPAGDNICTTSNISPFKIMKLS